MYFNVTESKRGNDLESCKKKKKEKDLSLGNTLTHAAARVPSICSRTHNLCESGNEEEKETHRGEDELWALPIVN